MRRIVVATLSMVLLAGCGSSDQAERHPRAQRDLVPGCDRLAMPATFASQVAVASEGQTICLESGDYGIWAGTDKRIFVRPERGSRPQMQISFGPGATGFSLDGMAGMGGKISAGASGITIRDSTFDSQLDIEGQVSHVVVSHNDFRYPVQSTAAGPDSKIFLNTTGESPGSAVTIESNDIENGDLDGVHMGGSGELILSNRFRNLCDRGVNHTDNIQLTGGREIRIAGNYVYEAQNCPTQGITSYDGGTSGVIIEDNVVDVPRDWGIEFYSDKKSIIRHNTLVYHPSTYSEFHTPGGQIAIDRKSQDPPGSGTQVYDNIATSVGFANGSTGAEHDNVSGEQAKYVGPSTEWLGFRLAPDSPVGVRAASDGTDVGIDVSP